MAKAVQMAHWDYVSIIWATLANANRDEKSHPKPFEPEDIHPLRKKIEPEDAGEPDWAQINQIKKQYKVTRLHGRKRDQSGGSLPDAERPGQELS